MPRKPTSGGDNNAWGDILNEYLEVEHKDNGDLRRIGDRLGRWRDGGFAGKTACFVGDSTTSNATAMFDRLRTHQSAPGSPLDTITDPTNDILNYGENGATAAAFLSDGVTHGITNTIAAQADLYVVCYGINDVRLGLCDEPTLITRLVSIVDQLRAGVPDADIVLRVPNSFLTTDVGANGFVSPNASAQAYTDILRAAYLSLVNRWPNVLVWDAMAAIFGTTCQATSAYMTDQLHPNADGYAILGREIAKVIGRLDAIEQKPFLFPSPARTTIAQTLSAATPWTIDYDILTDTRHYEQVAEGRYIGQGSGFLDFDFPGTLAGQIYKYDIVVMPGVVPFQIPAGSTIAASGANTRITGMGGSLPPANSVTSGYIRVYRKKYADANLLNWSRKTSTQPYQRKGIVNGGGTNFIDIERWPDHNANTEGRYWNPTTGDTLVIEGQSDVALTSATWAATGNHLRISVTGSFSGLTGKQAMICGNHRYEAGRRYPVTVDPTNVTTMTATETSVTVTGALTTDLVVVQPPTSITAGLIWCAYVSAADTVKLRLFNATGVDIDPASATWTFLLVR